LDISRTRLPLSIGEGNIALEAPRRVFGGVADLPSIVLAQPAAKVVGDADIEVVEHEALEDVDVDHAAPSGRCPAAAYGQLRRSAYALRASARQPPPHLFP